MGKKGKSVEKRKDDVRKKGKSVEKRKDDVSSLIPETSSSIPLA
jgi:hypothetical protein